MNILRRAASGFTALVVGTSSLLALAAPAVVHAAGQTCTWTGGGGDNKFSTVANWSDCGGAAPTNDDSLVFDISSLTEDVTVDSDINGLSVANIAFTGNNTSYNSYTIDGDSAITVTGSITSTTTSSDDYPMYSEIAAPIALGSNVSVSNVQLSGSVATGSHSLSVSTTAVCDMSVSNISGSGAVTISSGEESGITIRNENSSVFTGTFTATSGARMAFNTTAALSQASSVTANNATVSIGLAGENRSISQTFNLSGRLVVVRDGARAYACSGAADPNTQTYTLTLAKGLSLNGNLEYSGYFANTVVSQPYAANGHTASVVSGSNGGLTLPSGTVEVKEEKKEYNDNKPGDFVSVGNKQTAIINGTRGGVNVGYGGTLKGTGTVGSLTVAAGGIIAPGLSPGCLTSNTLSLSGEYQFELGGADPCTGYDQLVVKNSDKISNAVNFGDDSAVLTTSRYDNYTPKKGQVFVIINQEGDDAVSGTFKDLPEGATFEQNGVVFKISYVGGDGNDVTLTVQNVPSTPDTGFALVSEHPVLSAAVLFALSGAIIALARRGNKLSSKKA